MVGTGTSSSAAAGRLSHVLGLTGPARRHRHGVFVVAGRGPPGVPEPAPRRVRAALAGGVSLMLASGRDRDASQGPHASPDGRCKTFDAAADGTAAARAAAFVVLKRAGRRAGLTATRPGGDPRLRGQPGRPQRRPDGAERPGAGGGHPRGAGDAGVAPGEVDYVEAHGTGTPLGDPIEIAGAARGARRRARRQPLAVGSVKTNIGHLEAAAGDRRADQGRAGLLHHGDAAAPAPAPAQPTDRRGRPPQSRSSSSCEPGQGRGDSPG